ncbi:MAG: MFS transporter [Akkermansia sp.]|nr:MFS transporter [Akkermansia sp.]
MQETIKSLLDACASLAGTTPWAAIAVAVAAVLFALKKGIKSQPLPKASPLKGPGKWAWIAVIVLWVVVMLNYFDRQLLAVLNTSITSGEGGIAMDQAQFGMVTSAFLIVYAALSPVGGYLADRYSRKFIILCSLVVWSFVTWMTGKAESYEELLVWRGAMGISEAFYIPAALALISDYHRGSTRSMATGIHMSGIYAGQMLAGCGALMAGAPYNLGWRLTFETFGFIGVAYAIVVIFFLHDPGKDTVPAADDAEDAPAAEEAATEAKADAPAQDFGIGQVLKSLFTGRAMAMLLVMYACAGFANWFLMGWYPRLLQDMFHISEAQAGPTATLWINIAKYAAVLLAAVVADRWYLRNKNARAYVPGICFCVAGPCVIIAMLPALGVPLGLGLVATVALVSMQGIAQGSLDATLMPVLRSQIDERFSATGYGLLNLTSVAAGAVISTLGGVLKDNNVDLGIPLSLAGVLMVICGAFFFFLPKAK